LDDPVTVTPPTEPVETPPANPDADELAALRKEKADREAAAQAEKEKEIEELRAFKADQEAKAAKAVKAPEKKAEKAAAPAVTETVVPLAKPKRKRVWWPDDND
jgi:ATPase subunit of ABC transporter with duplicated ATPase domains